MLGIGFNKEFVNFDYELEHAARPNWTWLLL